MKTDQREETLYTLAEDYLSDVQRGSPNGDDVAALADVIDDAAAGWMDANWKGLRRASRTGMINISAWLPKEFKQGIRMVQAKRPDATLQDLMAEAFNELFMKYDIPTVAVERQEKGE